MVIWIIGRSGSGKSFFAKKIVNKLKKKSILIDGDEVRKYLTSNLGYTKKDRFLNSRMIQKLCKFLEIKNLIVVCAIQSIFKKHQKENRKIFKRYIQVYLNTDPKLILNKKHKLNKFKKNVVGKDINFPKPYMSDLIINNHFKNSSQKLKKILGKIKIR